MHNTFIKSRRRPRAQPARLTDRFPVGADGRVRISWAQTSPALRDAHNRLRKQRGLAPIPEPAIDLYKSLQPAPKPLDANPDALRIAHGDEAFWDELCDAVESLLAAIDDDFGLLRKRLRADIATRAECRLAADLLPGPGGKTRRPGAPRQLRSAEKQELARRFLTAWVQAGKPEKDAEGQPIDIVKAVQGYFGKKGLSRTVVHNVLAKIKMPAPASLALSGSTPIVAVKEKRTRRSAR
jgi:hypothetical protein